MVLQKADIDQFQSFGAAIPRYLFRGIRPSSGGGNPKLNSKDGVVPHRWLPPNPEDPGNKIDALDPVKDLDIASVSKHTFYPAVYRHIAGIKNTCFSSWTHDFPTAVNFATRYGCSGWNVLVDGGSIAVLDTHVWLPDQRQRSLRIFHTLAFVGIGNWTFLNFRLIAAEYLIWGPVPAGPAFRLVSIDQIRDAMELPFWPTTLLPLAPHPVMRHEVREATSIGALFGQASSSSSSVSDNGSSPDDVAVTLVVAAAELARRQQLAPLPHLWGFSHDYQKLTLSWSEGDGEGRRKELRRITNLLFKSMPDLLRIGLESGVVNAALYTTGFPQVQLMQELLGFVEQDLAARFWASTRWRKIFGYVWRGWRSFFNWDKGLLLGYYVIL